MSNFKVGDKVRCIKDINAEKGVLEGRTFIISELSSHHIGLEGVQTECHANWGDWCFELVEDTEFKIGDSVMVSNGGATYHRYKFVKDLGVAFIYRYLVVDGADVFGEVIKSFRLIKSIKKEYTMDEIAEKFDIPVEELKIKK